MSVIVIGYNINISLMNIERIEHMWLEEANDYRRTTSIDV